MTRFEELMQKILNGEQVTDWEPRSNLEKDLLACINGTGLDGLHTPITRMDELLQALAVKIQNGGTGGGAASGTAVPNSGVVEKLYINSHLTAKEVYQMCDKLNFYPFGDTTIYPILVDSTFNRQVIVIVHESETQKTYLLSQIGFNGKEAEDLVGVRYVYDEDEYYYEEQLENDYEIVIESENVISQMAPMFAPTYFDQNNLLTDFVSITPFNSGGGAVVKGIFSNAIPNNGDAVTDLYFNTDLTSDEVDQFLSNANLTYQDYNGQQVYGVLADGANYILYGILNFGAAYAIVKLSILTGSIVDIIYCSTALQNMLGASGWNTSLSMTTPYNVGNVISVEEALGYPIGVENDKLSLLISNTAIREVEKKLNGEYNGNPVIINDCDSNIIDISNLLENNKMPLKIEVNNNSNLIKFLNHEPIDRLVIDPYKNRSVSRNLFMRTEVDKLKISFSGTSGEVCIEPYAFYGCTASTIHLTDKEGGKTFTLNSDSSHDYFGECKNLKSLILDFDSFAEPEDNVNYYMVFYATPIQNGTGYIYVPDSIVDEVKAMAFWSEGASQIRPLSEYVEE